MAAVDRAMARGDGAVGPCSLGPWRGGRAAARPVGVGPVADAVGPRVGRRGRSPGAARRGVAVTDGSELWRYVCPV